jgi:Ala-tRNA(Pro) deacylase
MSVVLKLKEFLEKEHINYQTLEHNLAYTATEVAQAQHLPGHQVVKSVVVLADGKWVLCVLPATHKIDFDKLKNILSAKEVYLADEGQVAALFPGYEVGAMPPFGQFAGIPVYADNTLLENDTIAFNAGTHTDMVKIKFKDYMRIAKPTLCDFTFHI